MMSEISARHDLKQRRFDMQSNPHLRFFFCVEVDFLFCFSKMDVIVIRL